jgi:hypothetical protein
MLVFKSTVKVIAFFPCRNNSLSSRNSFNKAKKSRLNETKQEDDKKVSVSKVKFVFKRQDATIAWPKGK